MASIPRRPDGKPWRLLYYGDLGAPTGFNTVSKNILEGLHRTGLFEIVVLAVNNWGEPIPEQKKYKIYPASNNPENDPYGLTRLASMLTSPKIEFDVFFSLQDTFIMRRIMPAALLTAREMGKNFVSIGYFPIDGRPKSDWIEGMAAYDLPVAYTKYGFDQCCEVYPPIKEKLSVIPHGISTEDFYYIESREFVQDFRKKFFNNEAINDRFVFLRVDRNQRRKDYPRLLMAFKEFLKQRPGALLYCHCDPHDVGWNLLEVSKSIGLVSGKDIVFPTNISASHGFPVETMNKIYNACDCVVSTTLGGGWELCSTEAMATKTPLIVPNNTALTEIVGANEERGWLAKSGGDKNLYTILQHDEEVIRPLTDVDSLVEKMIYVHDNRNVALEKAESAYHWVRETLEWQEKIVPVWMNLIGVGLARVLARETDPQPQAVRTRRI